MDNLKNQPIETKTIYTGHKIVRQLRYKQTKRHNRKRVREPDKKSINSGIDRQRD
jgi:hypothetical protein